MAQTSEANRAKLSLTESSRRPGRLNAVRRFLKKPATLLSFGFVLLVVVLAVFAPMVVPYSGTRVDPLNRLEPPSSEHWFGTDHLGRDIFARVLEGARVSLIVGIGVTAAAALIGSVLGLLSGFYDRLDTPIMRFMDGLMAFPSLLLAIAIMASLGPSTPNVIAALAVVYTPAIARLVRSTTLVTKNMEYVESARAIGAKDRVILTRYIYANSLSPLIIQCTFVIAFAIIVEASLSFLGAGVPPQIPTWGNMIRDGQRVLQRAWWLSVFPGALLFLLVLSLNLLGDALRDALDPRARVEL